VVLGTRACAVGQRLRVVGAIPDRYLTCRDDASELALQTLRSVSCSMLGRVVGVRLSTATAADSRNDIDVDGCKAQEMKWFQGQGLQRRNTR
jgi:hypothetical protein